MATPEKIYVLDAMALLYRSFFAFSRTPLTTSAGEPIGGVYGSAVFLNKLVQEENPDYLISVIDSREKTFRHEMYKEYKATRDRMPSDLQLQLANYERLLAAFGCAPIRVPGFEADDLIGTIAKRHASSDKKVFIVSGDKDFNQLLNESVYLFTPKKGEQSIITGPDDIRVKYNCEPNQFIDILALMGDSSDNVPGVAGIGEKGAAKLISTYGSLEGIYENIDKISGKRQSEGLKQNKENAFLSRKLVTIDCDVDFPLDIENFRCHGPETTSSEKLRSFYEEFNFRQLLERTAPAGTSAKQETATVAPTPVARKSRKFCFVEDAKTFESLIAKIKASKAATLHVLPTQDDAAKASVAGLAFAVNGIDSHYVAVGALPSALNEEAVREGLNGVFADTKVEIAGYDLKQSAHIFRRSGLGIAEHDNIFDVQVADYLLSPNQPGKTWQQTVRRYLDSGDVYDGSRPYDLCQQVSSMHSAAQSLVGLIEQAGMTKVMRTIEMPLLPVLSAMEAKGVFIDKDRLQSFSTELEASVDSLKGQIYKEAGEEFNILSPKQLQEILFTKLRVHEQLGVKRLKRGKTGFSTDESVLQRLGKHPLPRLILEYREVTKLKGTYVDTLPTYVRDDTGRLHTTFRQSVAATGRLSSDNPNLQNIPMRSQLGREIRHAFRCDDPNKVYLSADYSQVEIRLLAHMAKAEQLIEAFNKGLDIHAVTAAEIFKLDPERVDPQWRSRAKAINFGIIYGMGPQRLAQQTGVSLTEAKEFMASYFAAYPGIKKFTESLIEKARLDGYSETLYGRRRPIEGIQDSNRALVARAENMAVNSPIQGTAADMIKLAMIKAHDELNRSALDATMILQVHDELVFEVAKKDLDEVQQLVRTSMEDVMEAAVPFKVDMGFGADWLEAHG